ncbi:glutamine--fructose-6-phosphate transaminase (isomerizing) [Thermodesulfobacteriota bacterium]
MCGIVGFISKEKDTSFLVEGLKKLEYRGYDSAGVAVIKDGEIIVERCKGKIRNLEKKLADEPIQSTIGIGHTRWATHGKPAEENAHPHQSGGIVVVHNGIIENYLELKEMLKGEGHKFTSETDTEILPHLISRFKDQGEDLLSAVKSALKMIRGSYALTVMSKDDPDRLIAARQSSPLVIGVAEEEYFVASDVPAILSHTNEVVFLDDGEVAELMIAGFKVTTLDSDEVIVKETTRINWSPVMAEKAGYKHFMLKEIFEQPQAIIDTMSGRISEDTGDVFLPDLNLSDEVLKGIKKITIIACGTSWHAALVGKFLIEEVLRIPVEVDLGSEFRYRNPIVDETNLLILISQSGETADTLAALKEGKKAGAKIVSICNVVGSSITRASDGVIYTHAGPEIGVASTKAFTTQIVALYLFTIYMGNRCEIITKDEAREMVLDLVLIPNQIKDILKLKDDIDELSKEYSHATDFLYLGRGINYPIALEGALKLKEISYIHAEGYPAGEMKHGPIALIDEELPVVVIAVHDKTYEKILSNIEEVKARSGKVIAIMDKIDDDVCAKIDGVIKIPSNSALLMPLLTTIPMQLIAYSIADFKGTDVDQPRNLAKSVTVE